MDSIVQEMVAALNNIEAEPFMGEMEKVIDEIGKSVKKKKERAAKVKIERKFKKRNGGWANGIRWERPLPPKKKGWGKLGKHIMRWKTIND